MCSVWHLEPSSFSVWRSELCLYFGIQIHFPSWHSVPPSSFSFGVQSRCAYSFRHLESPSSFSFGVQSCCAYLFSHLKSPSLFSFDVQSHYAYSFRHFESPPFLLLEFKVIFFLSLIIQNHSSWCSYSLASHILPSRFYIHPLFPHLVVLCLSLVHHALLDFPFPGT